MKCNWRDIPANTIAWADNPISKRAGMRIEVLLWGPKMIATVWDDRSAGAWRDLTLGQIADLGERHWKRCNGIGEQAVDAIKAVIDMAAEGRPPMKATSGLPASDAYVPKVERSTRFNKD